MYHPFSVTETISISWRILRKNFATISVYSILAFVIIILAGFFIYNIITDPILTTIGIVFLLVGISFIFLGFIKLAFRLLDKELYDFDFSDIVPGIKMLFSYLVLLVIVSTLAVLMTNLIERLEEGMLQSVLGIFVG